MPFDRIKHAILRAFAALATTAAGLAAQDAGERAELERIVFAAYPEADAFRCIARDVDQTARRVVEGRLPFKVHFNELGEHRLLVAFRGRRPVGLVYRRVEDSEWGLTEIAWRMTLDLRIVGFEFVRGRNAHITTLPRSQFARDLTGRDLPGLQRMLRELEAAGTDAEGEARHGEGSLSALQRTVLRSAIKALTVTDVVWRADVEKLADQALGFELFPSAARFVRRSTSFELDAGTAPGTVDVKAVYAYDRDGGELGCVAWTNCPTADVPIDLRWVIDRDQHTVGLTATQADPPVELRKGCTVMLGRPLAEPPDATEPLPALSRSLAKVLPRLANGRSAR